MLHSYRIVGMASAEVYVPHCICQTVLLLPAALVSSVTVLRQQHHDIKAEINAAAADQTVTIEWLCLQKAQGCWSRPVCGAPDAGFVNKAGPFMDMYSILDAHGQQLAVSAESKTLGITKAAEDTSLCF